MKASLLNIGDELLIGQVVNTNAAFIAKQLTNIGIDVCGTYVIGDYADEITTYLHHCLDRSDVVLMTGGLGPTKDDITKKTLCEFFDSELYENQEALDNVKRIFAARGYELTPINRQQSWVPKCCTMINNILGTAPCMWFETKEGKVVVSMPGVPFETENLMITEIIPRLQKHFHTDYIINKNLLTQGIGESFLSDMIESWENNLPKSIRLAYLPQAGMVKLRLTARGSDKLLLENQIDEAVKTLYPLAGQYIVGEDLESLPEFVAYTMKQHGVTLAAAESCTGGSVASRLTALAGASEYFRGGVVSYCNEVKECALGVRHATLEEHTAVSEATVREMAQGVRERLGADYGIATTGIAGPGGGTPEKPVGTVWIGIATPKQVYARLLKFGDRRAQIVDRTCNTLYSELVKLVNEEQR